MKDIEEADPKFPSTTGELLRLHCRRMDSIHLWRFMISCKEDPALMRKEIADAITESVDACRLVIDAVDDFLKQGESVEIGGYGCEAIGMLLWAFFDSRRREGPTVSDKIKERAAEVASEWRKRYVGKGDGEGEGGGEVGGAEAQIFLQLVVAFGLSSRFDGEELRKLVLEHASRKEMAKLAAGLGFGDKMTEIIDELAKNEKELEALCFACEAGLSKMFAPDPLLRAYLHNARKKATVILKNGNHSAAATDESINVESKAIRSIIECIEYYKLNPQFSIDGLKKRLTNIEKAKSEQKRREVANKTANKRAQPVNNSAPNPRPSKAVRTAPTTYAASYHNSTTPHTYDNIACAAYGVAHAPTILSAPYGGISANYSRHNYAAPHTTSPTQPKYSYRQKKKMWHSQK